MDLRAATSGRALLVGTPDATAAFETILRTDSCSWECTSLETTAGVLRRVRSQPVTDLVLLMPGTETGETSLQSCIELCRDIKHDTRTAFVLVVFLLQPGQEDHRTDIYTAGADDCIEQSGSPREILVRLSNSLRIKRATDSLEDSVAVITSLANAIEGRDGYTHGHVDRVSTYCVEIGKRIGVAPPDLCALNIGGVVHDIGKVVVPDYILNKPGKLSEVEMELMKHHPIAGYDILQPMRTFREVLPIVRWHHERPNGKGYPDGLRGDELPLLPRIVAVADWFDALSTARPYRPPLPLSECREILSAAAENEDLDPSLVQAMFDTLGEASPVLSVIPG